MSERQPSSELREIPGGGRGKFTCSDGEKAWSRQSLYNGEKRDLPFSFHCRRVHPH